MTVRRVRLDDDEPGFIYEPPESDDWDDDGEDFELDLALDLENEAEAREAAREHDQREREERADYRAHDLRPVSTDAHREQAAKSATIATVRRSGRREGDGALSLAADLIEGDRDADGWLDGVHIDRQQAERFRHQLESEQDFREWMRDNDPHRTAEGVADELQELASADGLTLDDLRRAFRSSGGRPSAAHRAHRERVRCVLAKPWQDGRRRTLLAEVLECSLPALYNLMREAS